MASVNSHISGRPSLTRQAVKERREQCYRLWLMGFNEVEISSALKIDQSNVSRHVAAARRGGSWAGRTATERFTDLLQQTYDSVMLTMKEGWRLYLSPEIKPEVKHVFLARVQNGLGLLTRLLPDAESMMFDAKLFEVREQEAQIRKWFEEKNMQKRILPVQNGS